MTPQRYDGPVLHPCGLKRLGASVPDSQTVPGVFIHAAAVEAVVSGHITATTPRAIVAGLSAATATAGAAVGMFLTPWLAVAVILVVALLIFVAATSFLATDIWIPLALPFFAIAAAPVVAYVVRYLMGRFAEALTHYRAMRFNEAYTIWNALAEDEAVFSSPHDGKGELPSNPSSLMAERARTFAANPPASPWDSVWILTSN